MCRSESTTVVIIQRYRLLQSCIQVMQLARYPNQCCTISGKLELIYLNTCDSIHLEILNKWWRYWSNSSNYRHPGSSPKDFSDARIIQDVSWMAVSYVSVYNGMLPGHNCGIRNQRGGRCCFAFPWYPLLSCVNDYNNRGIHGACPMEMLHSLLFAHTCLKN